MVTTLIEDGRSDEEIKCLIQWNKGEEEGFQTNKNTKYNIDWSEYDSTIV
jgi:hypothetical protein